MPRRFNRRRAAIALVEATFTGDRLIADKYAVSRRSIEAWRNRMNWDPDLLEEYTNQLATYLSDWLSDVPVTLRNSVDFLNRASLHGDPKDPKMVEAVSGAIAVLAEILTLQEEVERRRQASQVNGKTIRPDQSQAETN